MSRGSLLAAVNQTLYGALKKSVCSYGKCCALYLTLERRYSDGIQIHILVQLTEGLSSKHASVFSDDGSASVSLVGVLNEGVAFVNRAAQHSAVFGEDGLDVALFHHRCVQVADKHARVDRFGVIFVGNVARLDFQRHLGSNVNSNLGKKKNRSQEFRTIAVYLGRF